MTTSGAHFCKARDRTMFSMSRTETLLAGRVVIQKKHSLFFPSIVSFLQAATAASASNGASNLLGLKSTWAGCLSANGSLSLFGILASNGHVPVKLKYGRCATLGKMRRFAC